MSVTTGDRAEIPLYLAFELGQQEWVLGFTVGLGQAPRRRKMAAGDLSALQGEIGRAKHRFGLLETAPVRSCYEAGRDGFSTGHCVWLHRYLMAHEITNLVVDSASIEVNRRARRAKTDRLDVGKLLSMLVRYHSGEQKVWSVVHVPSVAAEDVRHLHRELASLKADRTRHSNRIKGLLAGQGIRLAVGTAFLAHLEAVHLWDGATLRPGLRARLAREYAVWQFVDQQVKDLEAERRLLLRTSEAPEIDQVRQLLKLRGIGANSAWLYVMEFFGWREFRNRRQLGGLAGLTPTPYRSGAEEREQGISKAGNKQIRAMAIEIAWGWLRHQPASELSGWYQERYGQGSKRQRKIGIVALARKLLIALWHYLEDGEIPAGAQLKTSVA